MKKISYIILTLVFILGIVGSAKSSRAADWRDIWSPPSQIASGQLVQSQAYAGGTDTNMRVWIKNAYFNGTINRVRIRLMGGSSAGTYKAVSICEKAASGVHAWDCASTPTPITFSSGTSVTVGANETVYSDEITGFTMTSGKDYLVNYWVNAGTPLSAYYQLKNTWQRTQATSAWVAYDQGNQTGVVSPSGYSENDRMSGYWWIEGVDGIQGYTDAQTLTAGDGDYYSVQPLLDKAADGDTISVPADSKTLQWSLMIWRDLTLRGAGPTNTIYSCDSNCVIMDTNRPNPRVTGFSFSGGASQKFLVLVYENPSGFRIDNNDFSNVVYLPIAVNDGSHDYKAYGLIDNNTFHATGQSLIMNGGFYPAGWDTPDNYGNLPDAIKQVFIENNTWIGTSAAASATDGRDGSRFVFRYNNLTNIGTHTHGPGQGWVWYGINDQGTSTSPRQEELYNNLITADTYDIYAPMYTGGGILISFHNKFESLNGARFNGLYRFRSYRGDIPSIGGVHNVADCDTLSGCYGGNPVDGNYNFVSGTATCNGGNTCSNTAITITPSIGTGRTDYYTGYRIFNTSDGSSCKITSNTLTTVTCTDGLSGGTNNTWSNGNTFGIRSGWPCIGQIGLGRRTCIHGAPDCPTSDIFENFPARIWANDVSECSGSCSPIVEAPGTDSSCLASVPHNAGNGYRSQYYGVANGDDYISCSDSSCALPGYVPFICPHPLASLTGSCDPNIAGRAGYNVTSIIYGDVDNSGSVSAYDAVLVAQASVGLISFNSSQQKAGDVDGNGSITAYDAALIAQKAVGLITKFPVE